MWVWVKQLPTTKASYKIIEGVFVILKRSNVPRCLTQNPMAAARSSPGLCAGFSWWWLAERTSWERSVSSEHGGAQIHSREGSKSFGNGMRATLSWAPSVPLKVTGLICEKETGEAAWGRSCLYDWGGRMGSKELQSAPLAIAIWRLSGAYEWAHGPRPFTDNHPRKFMRPPSKLDSLILRMWGFWDSKRPKSFSFFQSNFPPKHCNCCGLIFCMIYAL